VRLLADALGLADWERQQFEESHARCARPDRTRDLEIRVLRDQLTVLHRQVPRPRLEPADRALLAAVSRILPTP
jgi:putative transposase